VIFDDNDLETVGQDSTLDDLFKLGSLRYEHIRRYKAR
jgi:hypothetical protein